MCNKGRPEDYGYHIQKLGKNIKYLADENLIKHGITFEQVRVMRFLDGYSSDNPANQKDVEIMFELKRSSVTNILQNMEKHGLVTRSGDVLDGRIKKVWLTEKGKELYLHLRSYLVMLEEVIVQGMTEEEKDMFRLLLKKSIQNVETFMK
ncbi:MarR family transcriptional regulator [Anaerocolumna sp. AGMB13020]|uniref:MarR family winged helix-turn-helix transcriptional regulator n=1 Tax=Anaerocolumna sp. AGMB13020 TaxID=3081750 RepID=UPI0029554306|nr:MarR family transcriptional regulator [Anaerocolumna sp. AGMB13020]WOO35482.1 MarR family transcriptional regulator [Anaerocolumna sp. AGMB13020]